MSREPRSKPTLARSPAPSILLRAPILAASLVASSWGFLPGEEPAGTGGPAAPPRLAVVLVVADLPSDLLRWSAVSAAGPDAAGAPGGRPGPGAEEGPEGGETPSSEGLRRLLRDGVVYLHARHETAVSSRSAGLATLATGAPPARHGIPADAWIGGAAPREIVAWEEEGEGLVVPGRSIPAGPGEGIGPAQLRATTLAEELVVSTGGVGKAWSVSFDPAGAVLTAGRAGKAVWISGRTGTVASSTRYFPRRGSFPPRLPPWLDAMGAAGVRSDTSEGLVELAVALIEKEALGADGVPDLLYLHLDPGFGRPGLAGTPGGAGELPEDRGNPPLAAGLRSLDAAVERILGVLDERAEGSWVFALTADRGSSHSEMQGGHDGPSGGTIDGEALARAVEERLDRVVRPLDWVLGTTPGGIWINPRSVQASRRGGEEIESLAASAVAGADGVGGVFLRSAAASGRLPAGELSRAVQLAYAPDRFPDVLVIPQARWLWREPSGALRSPSSHARDAHVPLVFLGPGLAPRRVARRVRAADLAPTLATILGVALPSASEGDVLAEALSGGGALPGGGE